MPVEGFEGMYEVSSYGRVKSLRRTVEVYNPNSGDTCVRVIEERFLRLKRGGHDPRRPYVILSKDGVPYNRIVARLVAEAFCPGKSDNRRYVNHINGEPSDNSWTNLEWVTAAENSQHAQAMGLLDLSVQFNSESSSGEKNTKAKLTWAKVGEIRSLHSSGVLASEIAEQFSVSVSCIKHITKNRTWVTNE